MNQRRCEQLEKLVTLAAVKGLNAPAARQELDIKR